MTKFSLLTIVLSAKLWEKWMGGMQEWLEQDQIAHPWEIQTRQQVLEEENGIGDTEKWTMERCLGDRIKKDSAIDGL